MMKIFVFSKLFLFRYQSILYFEKITMDDSGIYVCRKQTFFLTLIGIKSFSFLLIRRRKCNKLYDD